MLKRKQLFFHFFLSAKAAKQFIILITPLLGIENSIAQNLVPNCSFEDTIACPYQISLIHYAVGWNGFGDSPDYFNACYDSPFYGVDVPINRLGFQYAATGQAYAGIISYVNNPNNPLPGREWIGRKLSQPLQIGQQYFVSFKTSLSCYDCIDVSYASDKIGVLFITSASHYPHEIPPVNNFAHLFTDSIITDTLNWITVSGWFTADSSYQYIILGNFFDNAHTNTIQFSTVNQPFSYYYIDDVCVSIDSTKCNCDSVVGLADAKSSLIVAPNPTNDWVKIHCTEYFDASIVDLWGKKVLHASLSETDSNINLSFLPAGQYTIVINTPKGILFRKILLTK